MSTSIASAAPVPIAKPDTGTLSGFGPIFRKEIQEWFATNRAVMASIVSTLLTVVGPLGYWIYKGGLRTGKLAVSDSSRCRRRCSDRLGSSS
jgi:hypothetical protein